MLPFYLQARTHARRSVAIARDVVLAGLGRLVRPIWVEVASRVVGRLDKKGAARVLGREGEGIGYASIRAAAHADAAETPDAHAARADTDSCYH